MCYTGGGCRHTLPTKLTDCKLHIYNTDIRTVSILTCNLGRSSKYPFIVQSPCHVLYYVTQWIEVIRAGVLYHQGAGTTPEVSTLVTFHETKHWRLWQGGWAEPSCQPWNERPSNGTEMAVIRNGVSIYHWWSWQSGRQAESEAREDT